MFININLYLCGKDFDTKPKINDMGIEDGIAKSLSRRKSEEAMEWFKGIVQKDQYVGDSFSINYNTAKVIIHNYYRQKVGGIPSLCFLIATRIDPYSVKEIDFTSEDASVILLRVMDSTTLPSDMEAERIRVETAERVSGETGRTWDGDEMDMQTKNHLDFAGVECRIIGTFYLEENPDNSEARLSMKFGSDISNYYPNRGLKIFKPNGKALQEIVNYCDPVNLSDQRERFGNTKSVRLGHVRYASTNRKFQHIDDIPVSIYPSDLLSQKTALFGMTRTGKSNTTKIIAKSVYLLRKPDDSSDKPLRIGQIIFDPNGEYANENVQDNNNALKNVYKLLGNVSKDNEVVTYGVTKHPNDPDRRLMLLNFYKTENLQLGKDIINMKLEGETSNYVSSFRQVSFDEPDSDDRSAITRYNRRVLLYRAILAKAGFRVPNGFPVSTKGLFSKDLLKVLKDSDNQKYQSAAQTFETLRPSLYELANAFTSLEEFTRTDEYKHFNNNYTRQSKSGQPWADSDFMNLLGILQYPNGVKLVGRAKEQHSPDTSVDYAKDIYDQLKNGKFVIVDQSCGDQELNKSSAKRIMEHIFRENQKLFVQGREDIPEILVYIEEAHNILPSGSDLDMKDIWVRTAKEGAKYKIGMVYATQEVSSIQKNILRNTANWFIAHLNNTDETKELCKYYDFADFEPSIRRAQDKGFLRVKTLSNPYVIPVQVDKFIIEE